MTEQFTSFADALRFQARLCEAFGSAFSGAVLQLLAADVARGGPFAELASPWAGRDVRQAITDAAPLRLLGGLHYLALTGAAPELARHYPTLGGDADPAALAVVLPRLARDHHAVLAQFMTSPPQTNEVARSKCLLGGFLTVASETGLPLRCLELGSSAGLNQNWRLYRYELDGGRAFGDPDSPVRLAGGWSGGVPPLDTPAVVAERMGCDLNPIDVAVDDQALRLQAYVWPDQPRRLANLRAAITLARATPPELVRADAADWAAREAAPRHGLATVLFHSVVWQYLPGEVRAALQQTIRAAGEAATSKQPFAWLRMEPSAAEPAGLMEVRLSAWPGRDDRLLARVHPHGATVEWVADPAVA